jgi:heme-degrading monooxygenase HmoA
MIQIVWQYEVKETFRAKFELAYGPGGAWSQLFGASPGYRGTVLLRDTHHPRRYLSIDSWDAEDQYEAFLKVHRDEYSSLDATFQEWTDAETKVGIYKLLAEATVRPRPGAGSAGARPRGQRGGA